MPTYAFQPPQIPSLSINGTEEHFPIRRIFCVGRNYADHAREMGHDPDREPPFFFTKPADAVVEAPANVPYPPDTNDLHHEIELVIAIGEGGADIATEHAEKHIFGYALGVDLTRRDLQAIAKKKGRPWDWSKGFDNSALCTKIYTAKDCGDVTDLAISIDVNGENRQTARTSDMIWPIPDIIAYASRSIRLEAGDLIYTGTPAGVSQIVKGDKLAGKLADIITLESTII